MRRNPVWHGCLTLAVGACLAAADEGEQPLQIRSRVLDIEYSVDERALPLESVKLWYTLDGGETWNDFGFDDDRRSPLTFHAPAEGLYGFFLVLRNATGASSTPPTQTTKPHLWAFVDYTPPVVQLHPVRQSTSLGQRVLQIRWTAVDAHLQPRPVEITYQRLPDETWIPVTPDALPNTGQYDWRLPEVLSGPVAVRVTVTDRGGHRVRSGRQVVEVTPSAPRGKTAPAGAAPDEGAPDGHPVLSGSARAAARASRLYREAIAYRERGEYRAAIGRLREAVMLNPQWAQAFVDMADMLYRIGDSDRALNAYELALKQRPAMREALRGAARVYRQQNDHATAARMLRTILRYNPNDAEVWMNLGDVAIYQGDEVLARECYTRATQIDPGATRVIADARKRLQLMAEVSRRYRAEDD